MELSGVYRGGLWLYIGGLLSSFLGYLYWLIASKFVSPNVVGSAAAVLALQGLLVSIFSFGLSTGLQRFVGFSKGRDDYQQLSSYFFTSLMFTLLVNLPLTIMIFLTSLAKFSIFNLTSFELTFVAILILLGSWPPLIVYLFNSLLRTEITVFVQTISSLLRLVVGTSLLYLGFDFLGVMLGFIAASITTDAILLFYAMKLFREFKVKAQLQLSHLRDLLKASLASWIPNTLTILANSIGVLSIYGFVGGTETGLYYIAFAIAMIVYNLPANVMSLMFPVLSGMEEGRKRAISGAIQLSLAITAPIALALTLYPSLPLSLLGPKYVEASNILRILVLGVIISPIVSGYGSYIYAIGKYTHVTILGLVTTVSRLILYALLISILGATGIAIAFTLGMLIGLVTMLPSAHKIGYRFNLTQYAKTITIPALLAALLFTLNIHWLIGIPALLLASMMTYTRLGIISKGNLIDLSQAFLSKESISRVYLYAKPLIKLMYGE